MSKPPAHRPSRRDDIIDAAISVFAQKGFIDAAVSDVAAAAGVVVAAVYYHFAGKDDLYGAAIGKVLSMVDEVVANTRPDDAPAEVGALHRVIDAVWNWVDEHPEPATLMYLHGSATTRQASAMRREFDDVHVQRAFAYLDEPPDARDVSAHRRAAATLAFRTLVDVTIAIHPMRMAGGPLSEYSSVALKNAMKELSTRIVSAV